MACLSQKYIKLWDGWKPGPKAKSFVDNATGATLDYLDEADSCENFVRRLKQRMHWEVINKGFALSEDKFRGLMRFQDGAVFPAHVYMENEDDRAGEACWQHHVSIVFATLLYEFDRECGSINRHYQPKGTSLGPRRYYVLHAIKEALVHATALWVEINESLRNAKAVEEAAMIPSIPHLSTRSIPEHPDDFGLKPVGAISRTFARASPVPGVVFPPEWDDEDVMIPEDVEANYLWGQSGPSPTDPIVTPFPTDRYVKVVRSHITVYPQNGDEVSYLPVYRECRIHIPERFRDKTLAFCVPSLPWEDHSTTQSLFRGWGRVDSDFRDLEEIAALRRMSSLKFLSTRVLAPATVGVQRFESFCHDMVVRRMDPSHPFTVLLVKLYAMRHALRESGVVKIKTSPQSLLDLQASYFSSIVKLDVISRASDLTVSLHTPNLRQKNFRKLKRLKRANAHLLQMMTSLLTSFEELTDPRFAIWESGELSPHMCPWDFAKPIVIPQCVPEVLINLSTDWVGYPTRRNQMVRSLYEAHRWLDSSKNLKELLRPYRRWKEDEMLEHLVDYVDIAVHLPSRRLLVYMTADVAGWGPTAKAWLVPYSPATFLHNVATVFHQIAWRRELIVTGRKEDDTLQCVVRFMDDHRLNFVLSRTHDRWLYVAPRESVHLIKGKDKVVYSSEEEEGEDEDKGGSTSH